MSAKKVEIVPKVKIVSSEIERIMGENRDATDVVMTTNSPVVKNGLKSFLDQIMQFVSVGGDFV